MNITGDYHTHTIYSHGKGTIEQTARAAIARGLKRLAITDHSASSFLFGVRERRYGEMRREIDRLNRVLGGQLELLFGMEFNLLGWDETDIPADTSLFDIILLGYHRAVAPKKLASAKWVASNYFVAGFAKQRRAQLNTDIAIRAIERFSVHIFTHPCEYIALDVTRLADAAAACGVALELNAQHCSLSAKDVLTAAGRGATFVVNSDAHKIADVGNFASALAIAEAAGLTADKIANAEGFARGKSLRFAF